MHLVNKKFLVFKSDQTPEDHYRKELSKLLIDKFGRGPFPDQNTIREILSYSLDYYINAFQGICHKEDSVRFYQCVFRLHEHVTEAVYTQEVKTFPKEIDTKYVAHYRRILKFILEVGCEVPMKTGGEFDAAFKTKTENNLNHLMFIGDMILTCVELFAEQGMIDDLVEVKFTKDDLYVFSRRHHYNFIFEHLNNVFAGQIKKTIVDNKALDDLKAALTNCFNIKYENVGNLIATIHEQLKPKGGDIVGVGWKTLPYNLNAMYGVPVDIAEKFFSGLKLDKNNKMPLKDLVCRPYKLNRYMYRPIVTWNIDGEDYVLIGKNAWSEAIIQFATNGIPWGKAPDEWMLNACFKAYVHSKEDEHDKWLDDEVEKELNKANVQYDRNIKNLAGTNIDVPGLGEIDFIIVSASLKKVFVSDSKHLLGRYDMVNQKNDFNAFENNKKPYNKTMMDKLAWLELNRTLIQQHFKNKYTADAIDITGFGLEGIFILNSPTIYMFNSVYRIYTIDQLQEVLTGTYTDPTFMIHLDEEESIKTMNVSYPYFKKPEYIVFDPFREEEDIGS